MSWIEEDLPDGWPEEEPSQSQSLVGPEPSTSASGVEFDDGSFSSTDSNRATTAVQPTVAIQAGNTGENQQWKKALNPTPHAPLLQAMFHAGGSGQLAHGGATSTSTQRSTEHSERSADQSAESTLSSQGDFSTTIPPDGPINRRGANLLRRPDTMFNEYLGGVMNRINENDNEGELSNEHTKDTQRPTLDTSPQHNSMDTSTFSPTVERSTNNFATSRRGRTMEMSANRRTMDTSTASHQQTMDQSDVTFDPERAQRLKAEGNRMLQKLPEQYPRRMASRISEVAKEGTSLSELEQTLTRTAAHPSTSMINSGYESSSSNGSTLDELVSTSASSRQRVNEVASLGIIDAGEPETSSSAIDLDLEPSALRQSFAVPSDVSSERRKPSMQVIDTSRSSSFGKQEASLLFDSDPAFSQQSHLSPFNSINSQIPPQPYARGVRLNSATTNQGQGARAAQISADEWSRGLARPSQQSIGRHAERGTGSARTIDSIRANRSSGWRFPPQEHEADVTPANDNAFDLSRAFNPTPISTHRPSHKTARSATAPSMSSSNVPVAPVVRAGTTPLLPESSIMVRDISYSGAYDILASLLRDAEPGSKDVNLSGHALESIKGLDQFLPNAFGLRLSNNRLTTLEGLPPSLVLLDIDNNLLGPQCTFPFAYISTLDISHNYLTDLRPLANLRALSDLNISDNRLQDLRGLHNFRGLRTLNIARNQLKSLDINLDLLEVLDASENQIHAVHLNTPQLDVLRLDNNHVVSLDSVPSVRELHIENNDVIVDFDDWRCLEKLYYDGNSSAKDLADTRPVRVSWLPPYTAANKHTKLIRGFDPVALQNAQEIRLGGALGSLLLQSPLRFVVRHLDLMGCGIHKLPVRFAKHFPMLTSLNLANNNLGDDVAPILGELKGLQRLSLYGNNIQVFKSVIKALQPLASSLELLDLRPRASTSNKPYADVLLEQNPSRLPEAYREVATSLLGGLAWLDGEQLGPLDSHHETASELSLLYEGIRPKDFEYSTSDHREETMPNLSALSIGDHTFDASHSTPSVKRNVPSVRNSSQASSQGPQTRSRPLSSQSSERTLSEKPREESKENKSQASLQEKPQSIQAVQALPEQDSGTPLKDVTAGQWSISQWHYQASTFDLLRVLIGQASSQQQI